MSQPEYIRLIVSRLAAPDGTELVELECGHQVTRIIPDLALAMHCSQCVDEGLQAWREVLGLVRGCTCGHGDVDLDPHCPLHFPGGSDD